MVLHITTNPKLKKIFGPVLAVARWMGRNHTETFVKIRYFVRFHKFLNLKNPQTLNEKLLYMSLRTDTTKWTELSDKHAVRQYIKECGLEENLIPQYAHYERADQIDFDTLPEQFVIKTTHGSGDILLVKDKTQHPINEVKAYFSELLKHRYGELEGGKHYMRIKPGLTVEALIENDEETAKISKSLIDYKFWCFNGTPKYCWTCSNRDKKGTEVMTYDMNWQAHPEYSRFNEEYRQGELLPKPHNFDRMIEICQKISKGFPCVRVDLYNIGGKIYFGEMTFTSLGGMMDFYTPEFLLLAGNEIKL